MVGIAAVQLPLLDNTHAAWIDVGVPPEHRRRGIGAALLDRVETLAREARRTHAIGAAFTPPGASSAGSRFAAAHEYTVANVEGFKVLDLADSAPRWEALEAEVAPRIGDYRIVESVPHPRSARRRLRASGQHLRRHGPDRRPRPRRRRVDAREGARERAPGEARNRRFCAQPSPPTATSWPSPTSPCPAPRPHRLRRHHVRAARHRGHSLGLAVKLASHRTLMAELPECEFVRTSNADTNEHMNAVNDGWATARSRTSSRSRRPSKSCADARSGPSGRGPCAAPGRRGRGWAGCSGSGSGR